MRELDMALIPLTQGYFAIVDNEDVPKLSDRKWHLQRNSTNRNRVYAATRCGNSKIKMHRFLLGVIDPTVDIDHVNGNGLDNRKSNLRKCTRQQNLRNQKKRSGCSSKHKGVSFEKRENMWSSRICINGKNKRLGYFKKECDAAKAYNKAAKKYYGVFASRSTE